MKCSVLIFEHYVVFHVFFPLATQKSVQKARLNTLLCEKLVTSVATLLCVQNQNTLGRLQNTFRHMSNNKTEHFVTLSDAYRTLSEHYDP